MAIAVEFVDDVPSVTQAQKKLTRFPKRTPRAKASFRGGGRGGGGGGKVRGMFPRETFWIFYLTKIRGYEWGLAFSVICQ